MPIDRSVRFAVRVDIELTPALAARCEAHMRSVLESIEGATCRDDETGEVKPWSEVALPELWARLLDRQEHPFAQIAELAGDDLFEDYGWFGRVEAGMTPAVSRSDPVPDDLRRWFAGESVLAQRHNLRRIESRWRVTEVYAVLGEPGEPWFCKGEAREFKTHAAAKRYRDRLVAEGKPAIMQPGVMFWPDADEWPNNTEENT